MARVLVPGGKRIRFRAQVSKSGKRLQIIVPQFYHQDIIENGFLGKVVLVEIREVRIGSGDIDVDFGPGT